MYNDYGTDPNFKNPEPPNGPGINASAIARHVEHNPEIAFADSQAENKALLDGLNTLVGDPEQDQEAIRRKRQELNPASPGQLMRGIMRNGAQFGRPHR